MHWRRKWQPTPVFLPGESRGQRSQVGCHLWGRTESDTAEATWHACMHWNHRGSNPPACPNPKQKEKALLRYSFFFIRCIFDYFYVTPHCPELFLMLQCGDNIQIRKKNSGTPLVIQWLRLCISNAGGAGLILSQWHETDIASEERQFNLVKLCHARVTRTLRWKTSGPPKGARRENADTQGQLGKEVILTHR